MPAVQVSGAKVLTLPPDLEESRSRYPTLALCPVQLVTCTGKDCSQISVDLVFVNVAHSFKRFSVFVWYYCKDLNQTFLACKSAHSLKAFQPL